MVGFGGHGGSPEVVFVMAAMRYHRRRFGITDIAPLPPAHRRATGLVGKALAQQSTDEQGVCLGVTTYGVVRGHEDFDLLQERTGNKGVERVHAYDTHALRRRGAETEERRIRIGPNGLAE